MYVKKAAFSGGTTSVYSNAKRSKSKDPQRSLAVLLTGNFVTILDVFIVNVALPDIQRDLNASNAELQLIIVAYSVVYGMMLLNGARLGDLYGRRRIFLAGMAIFALSSLLCSLASSAWLLIGARSVQGLGAALLMPQVYSSLRLLFDGDRGRHAFAVMGVVQGVAGVASQTIGGSLIALNIGNLGWRLIFLVNLPVAAYALITGKLLVMETKAVAPSKLDIVGAFLGACALLSLLLPLLTGREQGWPWWAITALALALPLFIVFVYYESQVTQKGRVPIIEVSLFTNKQFLAGTCIGFLFYSAISSFSLSLTMLLQVGYGKTPIQAAMIFLPSTVAFFIGAVISAPAMKRFSSRALSIGMFVFVIGLISSAIAVFIKDWDVFALSVSVTVQGLGQGIVIPLLLNIVLSAVSSSEAGMASGAFSVAQTVGSSCGVTIVGLVLFSAIERTVIAEPQPQAYAHSFALATLCNVVAVGISLILLVLMQRERKTSL